MRRFPVVFALGAAALANVSVAGAQTEQTVRSNSAVAFNSSTSNLQALPPDPRGKSTIMGGEILNVDPVRDQFSLKAFGERPMKIMFDERTQVFRDGKKISLRDLGTERHASVQTVLDGTSVFALSVHILSQAPQGECEGQVLSFNPDSGELSIGSPLTPEPIKLLVPADTLTARLGQTTFTSGRSGLSDLAHGALVSVKFEPDKQGRPVARKITILAVPGSEFILAGEISFLDLNAGQLDLVDPRDEKRYQISFATSRIPGTRNLHLGDHIRVSANYESVGYVANNITTY
jgi:hypothetical protein